ncbi:hypothetical protein M9Y56_20870 [Pseudomonas juntendi]|uniref:DUF6575 domain-containing protein n=1 Tax=Pseudomonas TaxID=286 RepID=UPI0011B072E6|nr:MULTISPECIES: DUF6575 domain-containing protein [Pseudomonas]MCL8331536.1 hypothetical protein [Pseudomonas juntendi]MRT62872.1 hypothetical protein [Pseudomonas sp. CAH-1]HDS1811591.1 hypothetical protein [Pseudomonas putida]HDS3808118.1 hypothetical protein [Pseudomonas putida]
MKTLSLSTVLLDYDYPQVFLAEDKIGGIFVGMAVEESDTGPKFLCAPVSPQRALYLQTERIELREVFSNPELEEFYWLEPDDFFKPMQAEVCDFSCCPEQLLPSAGILFKTGEDEVVAKALKLDAPVAYASLSVPESKQSARIKSVTLAGFLGIYQNVLKNLARLESKRNKRPIGRAEEPYAIDVIGFSPGSFTVQMMGNATDILGDNAALSMAFAGLNKFLSGLDDDVATIEFLQSVRGHTASSLIGLLDFLSENNCPLSHAWASPSRQTSSVKKTNMSSIRRVLEICSTRGDIGVEDVVLVGLVESADRRRSSWRLASEAEIFSGDLHPLYEVDLSGVVIGGRYKFFCEEQVELLGTGKELTKLRLKRMQKISVTDYLDEVEQDGEGA